MIRVKKETEDSLLSITKNCETLYKQTHRKPEETLEFKTNKPRGLFHFIPSPQIERDWMIGLTTLEVYNSFFNMTEENNKFQFFIFLDEKAGGISYEKGRDGIERDLDISDITATDLLDEIIAPILIEEYREQVPKRMEDGGYMNLLSGYPSSISRFRKLSENRK